MGASSSTFGTVSSTASGASLTSGTRMLDRRTGSAAPTRLKVTTTSALLLSRRVLRLAAGEMVVVRVKIPGGPSDQAPRTMFALGMTVWLPDVTASTGGVPAVPDTTRSGESTIVPSSSTVPFACGLVIQLCASALADPRMNSNSASRGAQGLVQASGGVFPVPFRVRGVRMLMLQLRLRWSPRAGGGDSSARRRGRPGLTARRPPLSAPQEQLSRHHWNGPRPGSGCKSDASRPAAPAVRRRWCAGVAETPVRNAVRCPKRDRHRESCCAATSQPTAG